MDRLTEDDGDPTPEYDYDDNGNRTLKNGRIYEYTATTNLLEKDGSEVIQHDAAGNMTVGVYGKTFAYYQSGRLKTYRKNGDLKATYYYNAFGQRTRKVKPKQPVDDVFIYHYDRAGQLIAVTKNSKPKWDYLWADNQPIYHGSMNLSGSGVLSETERTFLITDHLNTPRLGLDENQTIVWRWDGDGFGGTAADNDPDGDGTKIWMDLRFPGQYADGESGLYYNWNRYYDPKTGRYITSDPIGLVGGLNTYAYVQNNPTRYVDPRGEFLQWLVPAIIGGGTAVGLYCYKKGIDKCGELYPNHRDSLHPDRAKWVQCVSGIAGVVGLGLGLVTDPLGSAASAAGGAATSDRACGNDDCK